MWLRIMALTLVGVVLGCASQEKDPRPLSGSWFGEVRALGSHGHSGFAVVSLSPDGGTRANLTMNGGTGGGVHPWYLREGTCASGGEIVGNPADYPLMEPDASGDAVATVALDVALSPQTRYHVAMQESRGDETLVGCGNLVSNLPGTPTAR